MNLSKIEPETRIFPLPVFLFGIGQGLYSMLALLENAEEISKIPNA
jgi:hypothetical protein